MDCRIPGQKLDPKHSGFEGVVVTAPSPARQKPPSIRKSHPPKHDSASVTSALQSAVAHGQASKTPARPSTGTLDLATALSLTFASNKHYEPPPGAVPAVALPVPSPRKCQSQVLRPNRLLRRRADVLAKQKELDSLHSASRIAGVVRSEEVDAALHTQEAPVSLRPVRGAKWASEDLRHFDVLRAVDQFKERVSRDQGSSKASDGDNLPTDISMDLSDPNRQEIPVERTQMRPYIVADPSRTVMFAERLEGMFGPGSLERGSSKRKPGKARSYTTRTRRNSPARGLTVAQEEVVTASEPDSSVDILGDDDDDEKFVVGPEDILARGTSVQQSLEVGVRASRTVADEDPLSLNGDNAVTEMNKGTSDVREWIKTLQKLVRGKARLDREDMQCISDILDKMSYTTLTGSNILENSELRQTLNAISELPESEIPFGDEHALRLRAQEIFHRLW